MGSAAPVLEIDSARIGYRLRAGELTVVPDLSLAIAPGEAFGLVGESGCGKSTVALAVMGYLGAVGRLAGGRILVDGQDIARLPAEALRRLRGARMAMVYQDPMSSLNPTMTVGRQLMEVAQTHLGLASAAARARAADMLREVRLPEAEAVLDRYPHQLSGGQQQRVVIAMALMAEPALLVMDEPTTGLDVTVEAAVLDLVNSLRRSRGMALLFISHNLGAVLRVCDRVGVMYAGEIVEQGAIADVFRDPRHPYTRGLLGAIPSLRGGGRGARLASIRGQVGSLLDRAPGCGFAARCPHATHACRAAPIPLSEAAPDRLVRCLHAATLPRWQREMPAQSAPPSPEGRTLLDVAGLRKSYRRSGLFGRKATATRALDGLDLAAEHGRTLAIVGESGCGKSTFARLLTGLDTADDGTLALAGVNVARVGVAARDAAQVRSVQMVFQNPDGTLNPSHSIGHAVGRAVRRLRGLKAADVPAEVARLLETVRLPPDVADRMPRQLSGGQKQRVAIARALAGAPELLVADEPVSALDMSVQAAIVNLVLDLQAERGITMVFISHDLAVVRFLADRVAVMYLGRVVEFGPTASVFAAPFHPYTEALLSAAPDPDPDRVAARIVLEGAPPRADVPTTGCVFAGNCPRKLGPVCDTTPPPEQTRHGHRIACHIPRHDLARLQAA
jgi:peptide/nickel transport system ATP-binding protein